MTIPFNLISNTLDTLSILPKGVYKGYSVDYIICIKPEYILNNPDNLIFSNEVLKTVSLSLMYKQEDIPQ